MASISARAGHNALETGWLFILTLKSTARLYAVALGAVACVFVLGSFIFAISDEHARIIICAVLLGLTLEVVPLLARYFYSDSSIGAEVDDRTIILAEIRQTIAGYAGRLPNWDGMEGMAPSPNAIADSLTFLDRLSDNIEIPDNVYAPGDGEVLFQWRGPGRFIEIGFYGDDTISWYARLPGQAAAFGDDVFDSKTDVSLPRQLRHALSAVAG